MLYIIDKKTKQVVNTIVADLAWAEEAYPDAIVVESDLGGIGGTYDDGAFIPTPLCDLPTPTLDERLSALAALRYEKETAGIEVNGTRIRTDRETQSILDSAQRKAESNPDLVVDWKGENGWVELTSPQIIAIGNAVFAHVQACFKREKEVSELLDVDIETDITTGWPN